MSGIKERLKNLMPSDEYIGELYSLFNSVSENTLPLIKVTIEKGAYVLRQRINKSGKYYKSIPELSYPPSVEHYGRANVPGHPMFYCCLFSMNPENVRPRLVTLLETSKFVWNKENVGIERTTCSKWDVIEKLDLISLPFSSNYERPIVEIKSIQEDWNQKIKDADVNEDALALIDYMSEEIAKTSNQESDYFIIANFIYYILYINEKTKWADGIIYPSVEAAGEGFNLALKPEVVDKKLKFGVASLHYLVKNKEDARLDMINHSTGQNSDGSLIFEKETDFNEDNYKNFIFVN